MHTHKKLVFPVLVFAAVGVFSLLPKNQPISEYGKKTAFEKLQSSQSAGSGKAATRTADTLVSNVQEQTLSSPKAGAKATEKSATLAQAQTQAYSADLNLQASPGPVGLRIPSIKLFAPIVNTGLEPDGSLHVPSSPDQTGWFNLGAKPGDIGPAVITGHLDSKLGPGVLFNLKNVKPGEEIGVIRADGSTAIFTVEKLELYSQENFNTEAVYGEIATAGLRIITCAGTYSKTTRHYSHDLVVYATLKQIIQPGEYRPL